MTNAMTIAMTIAMTNDKIQMTKEIQSSKLPERVARNCHVVLLMFAALVAVTIFAQGVVGTIEESQAFDLQYDHTALYGTRIYTNGVLCREFPASEVRLVAVNATNSTYAVTMPGRPAGGVTFTATVFFWAGTNLVESDPSNALPLQFRPRKVGNLRRFQ